MFINQQAAELKINHIKKEEEREFLQQGKSTQNNQLHMSKIGLLQQQIMKQQTTKTEEFDYQQQLNSEKSINDNKILQLSSEDQITSSVMLQKRKAQYFDESNIKLNSLYSQMQTEPNIPHQGENIFQEIDLSAPSIRKCLKVERVINQRSCAFDQQVCCTQISPSNRNPIYDYRDYLDAFFHPKLDKFNQFYEAKVKSISDSLSQEIINNHNVNQQRNLQNSFTSQAGQKNIISLSQIQSISFQIDSKKNLGSNAVNFIKNYPIYQILSRKDKKTKKIAGKVVSSTENNSPNVNDESMIEQYNQYSVYQQVMMNFINIQSIIRFPQPEKSFSKLIESQFFFFIIGDYKKMKQLLDHYQDPQLQQGDKNNSTQILIEDNNLYNIYNDSDSSSQYSSESIDENQKDRKYDIDEFIEFKSQTTTSKITKMRNTNINNPFQDFSTHQKEKYNPNRNQFYNLPKYSMVFILELLSPKNLKRLGVSSEYQLLILKIVRNIKKSAKIKEQKKKIMYNHNHYNCLFLKLNYANTSIVINQQDLKKLHLKVFGVENLLNPFDNLYINILKNVIERIIMIQLELIQEFPLTQYIISNKNLYQFEKSKINYIERVISGISKLREGEIIKRF